MIISNRLWCWNSSPKRLFSPPRLLEEKLSKGNQLNFLFFFVFFFKDLLLSAINCLVSDVCFFFSFFLSAWSWLDCTVSVRAALRSDLSTLLPRNTCSQDLYSQSLGRIDLRDSVTMTWCHTCFRFLCCFLRVKSLFIGPILGKDLVKSLFRF